MDETRVRRKSLMVTLSTGIAARSMKAFHSSTSGVRPAWVFMRSLRTRMIPPSGLRTNGYTVFDEQLYLRPLWETRPQRLQDACVRKDCLPGLVSSHHILRPLEPVPSGSYFRLPICLECRPQRVWGTFVPLSSLWPYLFHMPSKTLYRSSLMQPSSPRVHSYLASLLTWHHLCTHSEYLP